MKFYLVVNYYLVGLSFKFHEDPCINVRARFIESARVYDYQVMIRGKQPNHNQLLTPFKALNL